jgi:hypothetical protein
MPTSTAVWLRKKNSSRIAVGPAPCRRRWRTAGTSRHRRTTDRRDWLESVQAGYDTQIRGASARKVLITPVRGRLLRALVVALVARGPIDLLAQDIGAPDMLRVLP